MEVRIPLPQCRLDRRSAQFEQAYGQVSLSGDIVPQEKFVVLGFVSAEVIRLNEDIWFHKLKYDQIDSVNQSLSERR